MAANSALDPASSCLHAPLRWVPCYEAFLIALFTLLGAVGIFHHELWRDETQAWLLARDSPSLLALFQNTHYEGHPLLWHCCLYIISRLSRALVAMQLFNLLLAIGTVWLIVKKSPFSLLERSLLIFGYFTFYEYAMLSRSYGLGVFLAFLFCTLYCSRPLLRKRQAWLLTITLGLLANTSILGLVMSGALAIALYYRLSITAERAVRKSMGAYFFGLAIAWVASAFQILRSLFDSPNISSTNAVVKVASLGNSAAQTIAQSIPQPNIPQQNIAHSAAPIPSAWLENADKLLQIVLKSYLPLPTFRFHFWNNHLLAQQTLEEQFFYTPLGFLLLLLSAGLVCAVLFLAVYLLRSAKLFLFVYALGSLSMIAIFIAASIGATRHYGYLFILFLVCLWLTKWSQQPFSKLPFQTVSKAPAEISSESSARSLASHWLSLVLIVHMVAGIYAYTSDLLHPFSASYQTAKIISTQLEPLPILAINQRPISPISGYIDRQIFYPEADKFGSFWDVSYPEITDEAAIATAIQAFSESYADFIAVLTLPINNSKPSLSDLTIQYLTYIGPSIVEDEAFFLYRVSVS